MSLTYRIRRAREADEHVITTLVRSEHLNPLDLDWRRFMLAVDATGLVGAAQLRWHNDDSCELGSLVVRTDARGRGIAARLIDALLARAATRVCMITGAAFAGHYAHWGFRRIEPSTAPWAVRRNYYFGRFIGGALSFVSGRAPKELAVLHREPPMIQA
jgi:N-acetylglutamate synthase-like GNAT family acetyltransferase